MCVKCNLYCNTVGTHCLTLITKYILDKATKTNIVMLNLLLTVCARTNTSVK